MLSAARDRKFHDLCAIYWVQEADQVFLFQRSTPTVYRLKLRSIETVALPARTQRESVRRTRVSHQGDCRNRQLTKYGVRWLRIPHLRVQAAEGLQIQPGNSVAEPVPTCRSATTLLHQLLFLALAPPCFRERGCRVLGMRMV